MIDFIVWSAILLAACFGIVWLASPRLRNRIERPKFAFLERVKQNDQMSRSFSAEHTGARESE